MHFGLKTGRTGRDIQRANLDLFVVAMPQFTSAARAGDQAFRSEDHYENENHAEDLVTNVAKGEAGENVGNGYENAVHEVTRISGQRIELGQNKFVDRI